MIPLFIVPLVLNWFFLLGTSSSRDRFSNDTLDLANWMKIKSDSLWNLSLHELTILGTHDSGAFNLSKYLEPDTQPDWLLAAIKVGEDLGLPVEEVVTWWGVAQPANFTQQLLDGVRYFDLRCGWDKRFNDWFAFHTEIGPKILKLITEIKSFLDIYTNEIVLIEATHLLGDPTQENKFQLINYFFNTFGNLLYNKSNPNLNNNSFPTYGNMIESNQRIFLTLDDSLSNNYSTIWSGSKLYNTYADSDNITYMMQYNDFQVKRFNNGSVSQNQLFKISWTLTPQADTVLKMELPDHPHTLLVELE